MFYFTQLNYNLFCSQTLSNSMANEHPHQECQYGCIAAGCIANTVAVAAAGESVTDMSASDIFEIINSGTMCVAENDTIEDDLLQDRCCRKRYHRRINAIVYVFTRFVLGFADAVLEGLSLERCTSTIATLSISFNESENLEIASFSSLGYHFGNSSTAVYLHGNSSNSSYPLSNITTLLFMGVQNGIGLDMWKMMLIASVVIVLPLEFWLITNSCCKARLFTANNVGEFCCTCKDLNDTHKSIQNPYCLCYETGKQERKQDRCMLVCRQWFWIFEDFVHILMSVARIIFFLESQVNTIAFRENLNIVATQIIMVTEILAFINKMVLFLQIFPLNCDCVCGKMKNKCFIAASYFTASSSLILSIFCVAILGTEVDSLIIFTVYFTGIISVIILTAVVWGCVFQQCKVFRLLCSCLGHCCDCLMCCCKCLEVCVASMPKEPPQLYT